MNSGNSLRWLIVEDALKDKSGHWFEYIGTFWRGLRQLGDEVTVLVDREAESFILQIFEAIPILPPSIWHRMSDKAHPLVRYARIPIHAWKTFFAVRKFLRRPQVYDVIFVPTVLVHHLLPWVLLIKLGLVHAQAKIILFFPNAPVDYEANLKTYIWKQSPTTRLLQFLLSLLSTEVSQGSIILGAETYPMRDALSVLTGLCFTYFPHPVESPGDASVSENNATKDLVMASYGSARHEKGSDLLYQAIASFNQHNASHRGIKFILQCLSGFEEDRSLLRNSENIIWIEQYFEPREYELYLAQTNIILLPYRSSSYILRVSRVVIEAIINGIPVITTEGTTLADQAREFGSVITCENENPQSLSQAIQFAVENYDELKALAQTNKIKAQSHFSVNYFRDCLLSLT